MNKNLTFFKGKLFSVLFLSFFFILIAKSVIAQPTNQTFNSSGTYTIPIGYTTTLTIQAWGGGAGGGTNSGNAKGGGGGGAYASITTTLTAGNYTVTVGVGGTVGNAGGNSSFTSLVIAAGGSSTSTSTGGVGGTTAASTGTTLFAGGNGGNGASTTGVRGGGGGGGSANISSNGGNGSNGVAGGVGTGGNGGSGTGTGGRGADDNGTPNATDGVSPGSGGGGRGNSGNSRLGAAGQVIVTVTSVLPVKFGEFNVYEKQPGVQIDWSTYSENNVDRFEVQRSSDGRTFSTIGQVSARNLNIQSNYNWFDVAPLHNINYYRIKSIDIDGKTGFTSIIKINFNKTITGFNLYPNPVLNKQLSLQASNLEKGEYVMFVSNSTGQQVYRKNISLNGGAITQVIQLPASLQSGIYSLQLINNLSVFSKSFMIQ